MNQNENNTTITVTQGSPLTCDEILHCESLFATYWANLQFALRSAEGLSSQFKEHTSLHKDWTNEIEYAMNAATYKFKEVAARLTVTFANEVQWYIKNRYNIKCDNFLPQAKNPIEHLTSCWPLIEHITQQVGHDLTAAGKLQIKQRFQNCFKQETNPPILEDNKIGLPCFASLIGNTLLDEIESGVSRILLDAICLFFLNQLRQPWPLQQQAEIWIHHINFDIPYSIFDAHHVSLQFYDDGYVTIIFNDTETAHRFYKTYELQGLILGEPKENQ